VPLPELPKLARSQPPETRLDSETVRLRGDAGRIRKLEQRVNQRVPPSGIRGIDAMGAREFLEDVVRESLEGLLERWGDARCLRPKSMPPGRNKRCAAAESHIGRSVAAEDFDGPLHFPELAGVSAGIRMETLRALPVRLLDRRAGGPAAAEPRRVDSDARETEDPKGGVDPLRLQIELAEIREDPAGLVTPFDAVPPVVSPNLRIKAMVPPAGETEESVSHESGLPSKP